MLNNKEILATAASLRNGAAALELHSKLKSLGVTGYYYSVTEGRHEYYNDEKDIIEAKSICGSLFVVRIASHKAAEQAVAKFRSDIFDFTTFVQALAAAGVYTYAADLAKDKITYRDQTGNEIFTEQLAMKN